MIELDQDAKDHDEYCSERELWSAVVQQAIEDSLKPGKATRVARERDAARNFFRSQGQMFDWICDHMNLNKDAVREKMEKRWASTF
ncbi:hypothetical protein EHM76_00565 [bacterium]|nr:MAG: hypothetical protein EHM76_00565 [bacterium]